MYFLNNNKLKKIHLRPLKRGRSEREAKDLINNSLILKCYDKECHNVIVNRKNNSMICSL